MAKGKKRWLPKPGELIGLSGEGEPDHEYKVLRRRGIAYLIEVMQTDPPLGQQRAGLMAVDRQGNVWTIHEPEKIEPWEG